VALLPLERYMRKFCGKSALRPLANNCYPPYPGQRHSRRIVGDCRQFHTGNRLSLFTRNANSGQDELRSIGPRITPCLAALKHQQYRAQYRPRNERSGRGKLFLLKDITSLFEPIEEILDGLSCPDFL